MEILKSEQKHLGTLTSIYNYYVRNTTVTFNLDELSEEQFESDFFHNGQYSGTYTIMEDGEIIGFGCINPFNKKEAYKRSAYVSIYLKKGQTGKGYGRSVLGFLERAAYDKGVRSLIALICIENSASATLFEKNGYRLAGELKEAGEKFGRLLDVVYYQKNL